MELELTLKNKDNELVAKISAYSLESLEEQMHKIEKLIKLEQENERDKAEAEKKKELARETQREIIRDNYADANRKELEKAFGQDNPEILDDDLVDAFEEFVKTATLLDLRDKVKQVK